jgi:hypothetical protein
MTEDGAAITTASRVGARHPLDPDPARSTKAAAVLALGVAAVVTGPFLGGIVPATVGLALARQARGDLAAGRGYLTGGGQVRAGIVLAWVGIALALAALVGASVIGLIQLAGSGGQDFPDTSD